MHDFSDFSFQSNTIPFGYPPNGNGHTPTITPAAAEPEPARDGCPAYEANSVTPPHRINQILRMIWESDRGLRTAEIAEVTGTNRSQISVMLRKLIGRGIVEKRKWVSNGTVTYYYVCPEKHGDAWKQGRPSGRSTDAVRAATESPQGERIGLLEDRLRKLEAQVGAIMLGRRLRGESN